MSKHRTNNSELYSFVCKNCGHTEIGNKEKVRKVRESHYARLEYGFKKTKDCLWVVIKGKPNHIKRPGLQ